MQRYFTSSTLACVTNFWLWFCFQSHLLISLYFTWLAEIRWLIHDVIKHIENRTCIRFKKRSLEEGYVKYFSGNGYEASHNHIYIYIHGIEILFLLAASRPLVDLDNVKLLVLAMVVPTLVSFFMKLCTHWAFFTLIHASTVTNIWIFIMKI